MCFPCLFGINAPLNWPAEGNYRAAFSSAAGQVFSLGPLVPPATHTITYERQTGHVYPRTTPRMQDNNTRKKTTKAMHMLKVKHLLFQYVEHKSFRLNSGRLF